MRQASISRFVTIVLIIVLASAVCSADSNKYDIRNIPLELLPDAKAVIRNKSVNFEIINPQEARLKVKIAVTIFSKDKQDYGVLSLTYNKFVEVSDLDGTIYDASGDEIRDLESRDVNDYSDFTSYALLDDNRIKIARLYYDKFPYTVEFTYELEYDGYLNWPSWYSRHSADPVQQSEFKVTTPPDYSLRWWCNKDSVKPEIIKEYSHNIYKWHAENLTKLPGDQENEDLADYSVIVKTAPSLYNIEGHEGSMASWKDFGKWYFKLSEGRDLLPGNALSEINEITKLCSGPVEKIKKLYNYMQSRTRYVSIQLGVGSWQPFDAAYVHNNGYGDCKALSNYMISILKAAGIKAYPVLIESGTQEIPLVTGFPCNQFNHVIVIVPDEKDTVWLECTSQDLPAGSLSSSCENRKALLVTSEGGKVINTPVTCAGQNLQKRTAEIRLNRTGGAVAKVYTVWTGDQHHYNLSVSKNSTFEQQEKWIKKNFKVPDIKLDKFSFVDEDRNSDVIGLDLSAELPRYGSVSGSRIFFNPNITDRRTNVPDMISEKLSPVKYNFPFLDVDSVKFIVPDRFVAEAVPDEINLETSFGSFISKTVINDDNTLSFIRRLEIKNYSIPPSEYEQYRDFFSKVVKADRGQVVLSAKK
jgi:transglutaminase-like putative cysteine protease